MNSIKRKLLLGLFLGWAVLFSLGSCLIYVNMSHRMYSKFDADLLQRAESIEAMIRYDENLKELDIEWLETGEHAPPGHEKGRDFCKLIDQASGEIYNHSGKLQSATPPASSLSNGKVYPVSLEGGVPARCVELWFYPMIEIHADGVSGDEDKVVRTNQKRLILYIAKRDSVVGDLKDLRKGLWIFSLMGILAGVVIVYLVVNTSLKPLDDLKAEIEELDEQELDARLKKGKQSAELIPITNEINSLLDRLEDVLKREREMTSNVAHELRTPVSGLLSNLEVLLSSERTVEEYKETSNECLKIATRMHWLVNNLLSLTRLEAGNISLSYQEIDLESELRMWWRPFAEIAHNKSHQVVWGVPKGMKLRTDPNYLRVVLRNLFDNAVAYTPDGGRIQITADREGVLAVANTISEKDKKLDSRVFTPFWRGSEEREGESHHLGLGLSLSRKVAEILGGEIKFEAGDSMDKRMFRVEVHTGGSVSGVEDGVSPEV